MPKGPPPTWDELYDRGVSEDELLTNVVERARWTRWLVHHVRNSRAGVTQGDTGLPDLTLVRPPRVVYIETKKETEKLRPDQERWAAALRACPGVEYYVIRPSDWRAGLVDKILEGGTE